MYGMALEAKKDIRRDMRGAPTVAESAEVAKWKKISAMWCKRALTAETSLAIMVEGIMK